ncbi:hypothetical protein [Microbacterium enclense]|uniref:Phosphodiesterase n=1 Tax=Microbacterium enclense TaxID=993073 RepID=A0A1G6QHV1_9MICO|nr:hypothetical protein [Microbacterium enclense]KSU52065.1 hypothetical protein AS029_15030 [Microbacterium enclense]SDC91504.1 hypothetical protein SAMN05216418_3292 [Microbacterium enclense]
MNPPTGITSPTRAPVARAAGSALARAFTVAQRLRNPRPIHSRGVVLGGEMRWLQGARPAGLAFVDDAPTRPVPVVARLSRSIGLPAPLPDVIGLAVRFEVAGRPADIEFASTGWNVPLRFTLLAHRRAERARLGILLPYRGDRGPVLLIARTRSGQPPATDPRELPTRDTAPWVLTLGHATAWGPWHPFAELEVRLDPDQADEGLRFDAIRHPVPGARTYAWVRAARQPSYVRVQPDDAPIRMPATPQPAATGT